MAPFLVCFHVAQVFVPQYTSRFTSTRCEVCPATEYEAEGDLSVLNLDFQACMAKMAFETRFFFAYHIDTSLEENIKTLVWIPFIIALVTF